MLMIYKNHRIVDEVERRGRIVAHVYSCKLSACSSYSALIWDGAEWWEAKIPSHDTHKDSPRTDPALRGQRQYATWTQLTPFQALQYAGSASEVSRDPAKHEDSRMYRNWMLASIDSRIKVSKGRIANWEEMQEADMFGNIAKHVKNTAGKNLKTLEDKARWVARSYYLDEPTIQRLLTFLMG